jgi:hypothetical protein
LSESPLRGRHSNAGLSLYLRRQADNLARYILEQLLQFFLSWIPTPVGLGTRALFYRLMLKMDGLAAIEPGVRLRFANHLQLGHGVYLDQVCLYSRLPARKYNWRGARCDARRVRHVYNSATCLCRSPYWVQ